MRILAVPAILAVLFASGTAAFAQSSSAPSTLEVHVNYTGTGTVDSKHQIYVVLWDSPDFMTGGAMPVELKTTTSKDGTVTFSGITKSPMYVSTVYDSSGSWDAQSPPPAGDSLGVYSTTPGKPAPMFRVWIKPRILVFRMQRR